MSLPTLYKRNSNGKLQQWRIDVVSTGYTTTEGLVGGKLTTSAIHTVEEKNPGKKNATSVEAQATKEATAKWKKKTETGYSEDIEAVDEVTFKKPMKGEKLSDYSDEIEYPVTYQRKLNGIRCQNDRAGAWSTGGKLFHTIPHIRRALAPIFQKYPDAFIDGEAFNHDLRTRLNRLVEIVSVVYQPKDITQDMLRESAELVRLHIFDGWGFDNITHDTPWVERIEAVARLIRDHKDPCLVVESYKFAKNAKELFAAKKIDKLAQGEGLMIRWGNCAYKHGRSKELLKLKHSLDQEFAILDIQEGNGDWAGCAKRAILALPAPVTGRDGKVVTSFAANIHGDRAYLKKTYEEKANVIGKVGTVEFQLYSEFGIPQLPWLTVVRDYE